MVKYNTDKDALFGSSAKSTGPKHKTSAASNRDALFGGRGDGAAKTSSSSVRPSSSSSKTREVRNAQGYQSGRTSIDSKAKKTRPALSGEAAAAKIKEAEDYKSKANKAMQSSFFSKPDPVAASTYYKRAADAFAQAGDYRMERFCRVSSGQCNFQIQAWASAAQDYSKAAELVLEEEGDSKNNREEAYNYHRKASEAWVQMNERAKGAKSVRVLIILPWLRYCPWLQGLTTTLLSVACFSGIGFEPWRARNLAFEGFSGWHGGSRRSARSRSSEPSCSISPNWTLCLY